MFKIIGVIRHHPLPPRCGGFLSRPFVLFQPISRSDEDEGRIGGRHGETFEKVGLGLLPRVLADADFPYARPRRYESIALDNFYNAIKSRPADLLAQECLALRGRLPCGR